MTYRFVVQVKVGDKKPEKLLNKLREIAALSPVSSEHPGVLMLIIFNKNETIVRDNITAQEAINKIETLWTTDSIE